MKGPNAISAELPYNPDTFQRPYVSAHSRARTTSVLLMVGAAVSLASVLLSVLVFVVPDLALPEDEINDPQILLVALLELGLGLMQVVISIATIVVFLMWLYRSYENLPSFGVRKTTLKYSSGWAVGSFFVPFVSLVVPYRAMKELWARSVPGSGEMFSEPSPPAFFPVWWATWLVSNIANQIYLRLSWRGALTPENDAAIAILTGFLDILAAVLALMVVKEIDKQQMEIAELIPSRMMGPQVPPPPVLDPA